MRYRQVQLLHYSLYWTTSKNCTRQEIKTFAFTTSSVPDQWAYTFLTRRNIVTQMWSTQKIATLVWSKFQRNQNWNFSFLLPHYHFQPQSPPYILHVPDLSFLYTTALSRLVYDMEHLVFVLVWMDGLSLWSVVYILGFRQKNIWLYSLDKLCPISFMLSAQSIFLTFPFDFQSWDPAPLWPFLRDGLRSHIRGNPLGLLPHLSHQSELSVWHNIHVWTMFLLLEVLTIAITRYIIALIMIIKIFQFRHPDLTANAYKVKK